MSKIEQAQLDAEVAREVFGIDPTHVRTCFGVCERWVAISGWEYFRPSTDIADAMAVFNRLKELGAIISLVGIDAGFYITIEEDRKIVGDIVAWDAVPRTICDIALRFVRAKIGGGE